MTRERGQASVLLIGALLIGLAFAGLAIDGARLFTARRDAQNLADSAALAAATGLDEGRFRATGEVRLEPARARGLAALVLAGALPAGSRTEVTVTPTRVVVRIQREVPLTFLRITGQGSQTVGATARAAPTGG